MEGNAVLKAILVSGSIIPISRVGASAKRSFAPLIRIALPGTEAKHLGAKAGQVVAAGAGRHQFDPAAGRGERHRPQTVFAAPAGQLVELAHDDVFGHFYRHWNTPLRQAYTNPAANSTMNEIASPNTRPRLATQPLATARSMPCELRLATAQG